MSDAQQGPGWWQASDLRWYPPELHPSYSAQLPPPPGAYAPASTITYPAQPVASIPGGEPRKADRHSLWPSLLAITVCVVYMLSPIDLAPEAFLGPFGLPDDILALGIAATVGAKEYLSRQRD